MARRALHVRVAKIGLPAIAAATLASIVYFSGGGYRDDGLSFDGVEISALDQGLKLTNPRFTGVTAKGEPFAISAAWALPDGPDPERVELSEIDGEINLADGRYVTLTADAGELLPKRNVVTLAGAVRMTTSDGYRLASAEARLDAEAEVFTAGGGVTASGPLGEIEADRMRVERNGASGPGDYIWFENRVKVSIDRPNMATDPEQENR